MRSPSERTIGSRVRRTRVSQATRAASLSRRALNFPRLNRRCGDSGGDGGSVFRLFTFVRTCERREVAKKSPVSSLTSYVYARRSNRDAKGNGERLPLSKEFELLLDGLSLRPNLCFGNNIVQFQGSNVLYAVYERAQRDTV